MSGAVKPRPALDKQKAVTKQEATEALASARATVVGRLIEVCELLDLPAVLAAAQANDREALDAELMEFEYAEDPPVDALECWAAIRRIDSHAVLVQDGDIAPYEGVAAATAAMRATDFDAKTPPIERARRRAERAESWAEKTVAELEARAEGAEEQCAILQSTLAKAPAVSGLAKHLGKLPPKMKSLTFTWAHDIEASLDDGGSLIQGLLDVGTMSVVYGDSNVGKTFWAADLATHVAMGWDWRDRAVKASPVVYVIAEGGRGFLNRIAAIKQHYGIAADAKFPLAVVRSPVDLMSDECDVGALSSLIGEVAAAMGTDAGLVVIDTVARAMAGGDENSAKDMGAFVKNLDTLREDCRAHLMAIHHTGKDAAKGARGHSSLRAATDTEIELAGDAKEKTATAFVRKQRDLAGGEAFPFRLEIVVVGTSPRGDDVTSAVVIPTDDDGGVPEGRRPGRKKGEFTPSESKALEFLHDLIRREGKPLPPSERFPSGNLIGNCVPEDHWRSECDTRRLSTADTQESRDKTFRNAYRGLLEKRYIEARDGLVWPMPGGGVQ